MLVRLSRIATGILAAFLIWAHFQNELEQARLNRTEIPVFPLLVWRIFSSSPSDSLNIVYLCMVSI